MVAVELTKEEQQVLDAMRASTKLKGAFEALVAVARDGELAEKSEGALANASAELPETKTAATISIEQMKAELRAADCLYDNDAIWKQLGATEVPAVPDAVIQEAHEKGGRVILRCSSISEKTQVLRKANHSVIFEGGVMQSDYQHSVSKPEWIVVPSHIDRSTLSRPKGEVVTPETPAPTPEDWFSAIAYVRLDGGRTPKWYGWSLYAFTNQPNTLVGSIVGGIVVHRSSFCEAGGHRNIGAARFAPRRN